MAQLNWEGIYPAMLSPFDEKGNLDFDMFAKNIEAQVEAGVHGLIIAGSLGEASVLSNEENTSY
ncbi:dihydrodipicolinate synthase family protein [Sphingobacterium sp. E70]|nr:dihydrodipicolinate synthase family protein [Sphingobacterium sp. E70]ULT26251.1 dihydrodipicolinate synthase family protein [Sphingobacterium sp. E70]